MIGDDEAREVGIVQDVLAGHWLLPRFNAELLPDKPILYHWLAAVPGALAGFSETAVRLPSALAYAALVGWTVLFGAELASPPVGLAAGMMLATTPALFDHARVARPDVLLVLLLAAGLGSAFRWWRDGERRNATAALVLLGAATFAKGPVGPVLFALAVGGFLAWQRALGRLPRLLTGPGVVAFLVLGLGWYAVALAGWGDVFVREHLVGRYVHNLAGALTPEGAYSTRPLRYHLLFYVEHLPAIALPWTPVVALGLWQAWRADGLTDPRVRFLLCWAVAPLVVFTPAETKLRYYLLPSLPALALLGGPALVGLVQGPARRLDRPGIMAGYAVTLPLGGLAAAALLVAYARLPSLLSRSDRNTLEAILPLVGGHEAALAVAAGFAIGVVAVAAAWRSWPAIVGLVGAGTLAWMAFGAPVVERAVSTRDSLRGFAAAVALRVPREAPLVFLGPTMRPVVVYLGRVVPPVGADAVGPGVAVIAAEAAYRGLAAAGSVGPPLVTATGRVGNVERARVVLAYGSWSR